MAAIVGLLIGTILGQRWKVLVLGPAILLILILAVGAAAVGTNAPWSVGFSAVMAVVGLQLGYLFGLGIRYLKLLARANRWGISRVQPSVHKDVASLDKLL
jgi:hypothetical protein